MLAQGSDLALMEHCVPQHADFVILAQIKPTKMTKVHASHSGTACRATGAKTVASV
jgi:hypothetical protein